MLCGNKGVVEAGEVVRVDAKLVAVSVEGTAGAEPRVSETVGTGSAEPLASLRRTVGIA